MCMIRFLNNRTSFIFWDSSLQSSLLKVFLTYKKDLIFLVWCIRCCFLVVPLILWYIYTQFDLIFFVISQAVIVSNLLKDFVILFWCPFSLSTCFFAGVINLNNCFIEAFSLFGSSLLEIIEYALLEKEEATLSLQIASWYELYCSYCSVQWGFLYANADIFPLFCFDKLSRNASSPLLSYSILKNEFLKWNETK